jgi:hypothetical protein
MLGSGAAGCSTPTGDVSGQVKFEGTPIASGRIVFQSQEGKQEFYRSLIKDGSFEIKGVPVGEVKITVESFPPPTGEPSNIPGKDLGIMRDKSGSKPTGSGPYVKIPERYGSFDKSGLTYTVTQGPQTKDFNLTDETKE